MKRALKNIILACVLFSYVIVGVLCHLEILNLLEWKTANTQIAEAKSGPLPTTKVYWTQNKHIPSTIKLSVPSPAVFTPLEVSRLHVYGIIYNQETSQHYLNSVVALHLSRAPPLL